METKQEISIRIAANPNASGGYRIIEGHNIIDNSFKENDYSGFSGNPYYFAFSIKEGWVDYCLLRNNVFSYGASRQSPALKIYVSIPRGYALKDKSPYDVLVDIMNRFLERYMTQLKNDSYEYKENISLDSLKKDLQDVARNYPLVPYNGPYRPMGDSAKAWTKDSAVACIVVRDENKIRELLADVQYSDFQSYGEIVVATAYDGTQYPVLNNLSIPRPCTYKVYIDGQSKDTISDKSKTYEFNFSYKYNKNFYDIRPVSFKIADLLSNGNKVDGVTIDAQNETINIKSSSFVKEKVHTVKVKVNPEGATKELLLSQNNPLNIYFDGRSGYIPLTLDDYQTFKLVGTQIGFLDNPSAFRVAYNGDKYKINNCIFSEDKKTFVINVTPLSDQRPITTNKSYGSTGGTGIVPADTKTDESKILRIDTSWMSGALTLTCQEKQDNKRSKKQGNMLKREVEVPSRNKILTKKDFKNYKPSSKYLRLIVFFLGIILGGIAGYLLHSAIGGDDKTVVEGEYICSKCDQPFDSQEELAEHKELPHCDQCRMAFTDAAGLKEHKDERHPVFTCSQCGQRFDSQEKFEEHEKLPHCDQCGETFTDAADLKEHKEERHPVFTCSKCGQPFDSQEELAEHKELPHCDQCRMAFTDAAGLNAHKASQHPVFRCDECDKEFKTEKERNKHYGQVHCACKICGPNKWFSTKEELESHMKTYHEER